MPSLTAQLRIELWRVVRSRRWAAALVAWVAAAFLASGQVGALSMNSKLPARAWDVYPAALGNWMFVGYILLVSFVFLVGDTLVADVESGWAWLVLTRGGDRIRWWAAKAGSLFVAAALFHVGFLAVCLGVAVFEGFPLQTGASPLAVSTRAGLVPVFAPSAAGSDMALRAAWAGLYETFAFGAVAVALVSLTAIVQRAVLPVSLALLGAILDWFTSQRVDLWRSLSPGRRLVESTHLPYHGSVGATWESSVVYFAAVAAVALVVGSIALRSRDL